MNGFEPAHEQWLQEHLARREGERRGRLERGHREAEKLFCRQVWWPLRGSFAELHPEYEVLDWRGLAYFCDFVWIHGAARLVVEIKGFGPHVQQMDRQKYCNELNRETFLAAMGFQVISFSYDDVANRPELCITLLRMVLSRYQVWEPVAGGLDGMAGRELLKLACCLGRPLRPVDVEKHLELNHPTAVRLLQSLCAKGWFTPVSGSTGKHIVRYALQPQALKYL